MKKSLLDDLLSQGLVESEEDTKKREDRADREAAATITAMEFCTTVGELKKLLALLPDNTPILSEYTEESDWGPRYLTKYSKGYNFTVRGMRSYVYQGHRQYVKAENLTNQEFKALIL